jgi:hypothetical protein
MPLTTPDLPCCLKLKPDSGKKTSHSVLNCPTPGQSTVDGSRFKVQCSRSTESISCERIVHLVTDSPFSLIGAVLEKFHVNTQSRAPRPSRSAQDYGKCVATGVAIASIAEIY